MYENLVAFQKAYDLTLYCVPILNKFPKSQRFMLAQEIEQGILRIVRFLMLGVSEKDEARMRAWKAASRELDAVRVLLRLAKDLRFVSIKQYGIAAGKMNELGKCIGGLLASSAKRSQTGSAGTFFARGGG